MAHHSEYSKSEIEYLVRHEWVHTLGDLLTRRTSLLFRGEASTELMREMAGIQSDELGWSNDRVLSELLTVKF